MFPRYLYIAFTLTIFQFYSCNNRNSDTSGIELPGQVSQDKTEHGYPPITPMEKAEILRIDQPYQIRTYTNTTVYADMKIGDLVHISIEEIEPLDNKDISTKLDPDVKPRKGVIYAYNQTSWQLSLILDNDIFDNRDYYYTNGFRIELVAPFLNRSPLRKILPGFRDAEIDQNGISITQNIYTPTNPDTTIILFDDHPFSAYLAAGQFRDNYNFRKKLRMRSEIRIGVVGPSSLGQQVQTSIHEIEPVGWQNQINNDIVIDYSFRIEKGLISTSNIEINAMGRANVGTLYNKAGAGLNLRFGNFMPVFKGPFSIFENKNPGGRVQYWLFMESQFELIGYDATLQGGMFSKENVYVVDNIDLNRFIFQASMGFALYYNNIGIEYEHFYQTPRFSNAYHFGWGRLKAVLAF